jgi:hypothetical protein
MNTDRCDKHRLKRMADGCGKCAAAAALRAGRSYQLSAIRYQ